MVLILGAVGAGKREYARSLGYSDADMDRDPDAKKPILTDLEETVRAGRDALEDLFQKACGKELVLCAEVGSGVIPVDSAERRFREETGRLCILLAKEADTVVRVVAGIPCAIKGTLPGRQR